MRALKKESVTNLSKKFADLSAATKDLASAEAMIAEGMKTGKVELVAEGFSQKTRAMKNAAEAAVYLGNLFGGFLASVAEKRPEVLIPIYVSLAPDLDGIVEAINTSKVDASNSAKEKKEIEIQAAAAELLRKMQAEKEAEEKQKKSK